MTLSQELILGMVGIMNKDTNVAEIINKIFTSLGYDEKLQAQAISDLEKVIAIRYYNKLVTVLPESSLSHINDSNQEKIIELARHYLNEETLQTLLLETTESTLYEYLNQLTSR